MTSVELTERVRSVWSLLLGTALILVVGVFFLRRLGVITETIALDVPATFAADDLAGGGRNVKLVTLLPKDGIAAIFDPKFVTAAEADAQLDYEDLVIGVSLNGEHKAYGVAHLSSHEVVNDTLGGRPIAVTW